MKRLLGFVLLLSLPLQGETPKPESQPRPTRPIAAIERVLIISIDGLRPDLLLLGQTPKIRGLVHEGAFSFWAETTAVATTLPSHVSMLTGVEPRRHKIEWNMDLPLAQPVYPSFPTVLELASAAGYSTAIVAGKSKLEILAKPGTVTHARVPEKDDESDEPVGAAAERLIREFKPELLFVHFPAVDRAGHTFGWGSPEQMEAIAKVDLQVGRILDALVAAGTRGSTLLILTADHGGCGKTHGVESAPSRHIPWIINGPGVRRFFDLTQVPGLKLRTEDSCATAAYLLGLPANPKWDGKPAVAAFVREGEAPAEPAPPVPASKAVGQ